MIRVGRRGGAGGSAWRRPLRTAPVAVAVVVAVVASAVANGEAARAVAGASALDGVLGTLEARFAVSHIRVEEKVAGDRTVDVRRDIIDNQVEAADSCRVARDGGHTRQGHVRRISDHLYSELAASLCRGIAAYRTLTAERLAFPRATRAGSPAETRNDAAFAAVLRVADNARDRLEDIGAAERRRMQLVQGAIVLVLSALVVAAGLVIRRRDRQLAAAVHEREGVLQSAGEGILAIDDQGTVRFANDAAARLLGYPHDDLSGRPIRELLAAPPAPDAPLPAWLSVSHATSGERRELRRRGGETFPIAYHVSPAAAGPAGDWLVLTFENIEGRVTRERQREDELEELRTMKDTLVPPDIPKRPGLDVSTCYQAAEHGVAGDFFLVAAGPGESTVIIIGDVAGKGVGAARRAAYVRTALATFAAFTDSPARLLELANRSLLDAAGPSARMVTALCVIARPADGSFRWATAGHPPPLLLDSATPLQGHPGLPLGLAADLDARDHASDLSIGSGLLLYTDGLSEARHTGSAMLGAERIAATVRARAGANPSAVADALRTLVEHHSAGHLADDLCMIVVRRDATADPTRTHTTPAVA